MWLLFGEIGVHQDRALGWAPQPFMNELLVLGTPLLASHWFHLWYITGFSAFY
jgi:hypothetical protein